MSEELLTDAERKALKDIGMTDEQIDAELANIQATGSIIPDTPIPERKDDILRFMRDIISLKQSEYDKISRVGNLKDDELGKLSISVRRYLDVAGYAETEYGEGVAGYLRSKSNIWADTSLSRKGFFVRLPFTKTNISQSMGAPRRTVKKSLFGGEKEVVENVEE